MAKNLTCYHGFYPKPGSEHYITALFIYFQTLTARTILSLNMRRYGGGLDKFEPNDLNDALVPSTEFLSAIDRKILANAVESLDAGKTLPASAEAAFKILILGKSNDQKN